MWDYLQTTGTNLITSPEPHGERSHHDLCCKGPAGQAMQQISDDSTEQNFLTQVIEKLMSGETLLNLRLTVLGCVKFGRNLDDTDCMKVKVRIMKGGQKAGSQPQTSVEQTLSLQGPGSCSVQFENLQSKWFSEHHFLCECLFASSLTSAFLWCNCWIILALSSC